MLLVPRCWPVLRAWLPVVLFGCMVFISSNPLGYTQGYPCRPVPGIWVSLGSRAWQPGSLAGRALQLWLYRWLPRDLARALELGLGVAFFFLFFLFSPVSSLLDVAFFLRSGNMCPVRPQAKETKASSGRRKGLQKPSCLRSSETAVTSASANLKRVLLVLVIFDSWRPD